MGDDAGGYNEILFWHEGCFYEVNMADGFKHRQCCELWLMRTGSGHSSRGLKGDVALLWWKKREDGCSEEGMHPYSQ